MVRSNRWQVAGKIAIVTLAWLSAAMLYAQQPGVHYLHQGVMPPGAIGRQTLQRGGPLVGFCQPVEIKAPAGAMISLAVEDQFDAARAETRKAGMLIGEVYRLRVTHIHLAEGQEVFPTIEMIDRLYAPPGQEVRFAVPIELTEEDLKLAIDGKFVTRIIYVEDPRHALPTKANSPQNWFEAAPGQDPLAVADGLGRPIAILRMGGRLPDRNPDSRFFYGSPPFNDYPPEPTAKTSTRQRPVVRNLPPPSSPVADAGELQSHINQEDRHSCLSKTAGLTHKMTDRNVCPPNFADSPVTDASVKKTASSTFGGKVVSRPSTVGNR